MTTFPSFRPALFSIGLGLLILSTQTLASDDPLPAGEFRLTGVEVSAINRIKTPERKISDEKSDTLTHWIRFDVYSKFEKVKGSDDKPFKILNPMVAMKLTSDKPIKLKGKVVPAGTDLLS